MWKRKFTGKDLDEETQLYYFNARWYSAELGRFISEDPVKDGTNWYVYAVNNPLVFIDPNGMYYIPADTRDLDQTLIQGYHDRNAKVKSWVENGDIRVVKERVYSENVGGDFFSTTFIRQRIIHPEGDLLFTRKATEIEKWLDFFEQVERSAASMGQETDEWFNDLKESVLEGNFLRAFEIFTGNTDIVDWQQDLEDLFISLGPTGAYSQGIAQAPHIWNGIVGGYYTAKAAILGWLGIGAGVGGWANNAKIQGGYNLNIKMVNKLIDGNNLGKGSLIGNDLTISIYSNQSANEITTTFWHEIIEIGSLDATEGLLYNLSHEEIEILANLMTEQYGMPQGLAELNTILMEVLGF